MQGIHRISKEDYINDPCPIASLSRGAIYDLLFNSPAMTWWNHPKLNSEYVSETADKFDKGTACHSLLLEAKDNIIVLDAEDWRKKAVKEERDALRAEGKTVLLKHQYDDAIKMAESARVQIAESELDIKDLQQEGESELTYIWQEEEIWLRTRLDWINKSHDVLIIDYKTTSGSANPNNFTSIIINNGLDIQCALYKRGVKAVEGKDIEFRFVVQETYPPYLLSVIGLPPEFEQLGKDKVEYGIYLWNQCIKSGIWEGYPKRTAYVDPPAWALAQFELIAERIGV